MMRKIFITVLGILIFMSPALSQSSKGIHLQAIARNEKGVIIPNKQISLRISVIKDSANGNVIYQEIMSVTTNVLGLFFVAIGADAVNKIITVGDFEKINWTLGNYYLQLEIDMNNSLLFINAGIEKINYVPLSLYAIKAGSITNQLPIEQGGTGVKSSLELLKLLNIDKVNNSPDSLKPISILMNTALNERLKKIDTISLSNRINQKLNASDTLKLSNRITALSNTSNKVSYGVYYDTSRQTTTALTATAIKFNFQQFANKIMIVNNSIGSPTKITVMDRGLYQVNFTLQFIKSETGSDDLNIWIRKNNAGLVNTNVNYQILGSGFKNNFMGTYFIELSTGDYIELYYSIKNTNSQLVGTPFTSVTPAKPATPSAILSIHAIN